MMEKKLNSNLFPLLLVTFVSCYSFIKCQDVVYNLTEESPDNTYLGNVAINSNLQSRLANPADFNSITYSFIKSEHVSKFRINETSSTLYTSTVIDRDTLCEFKSECVIILEVIAKCKSSSCYEKLVVKINVIDVNDNYPTFPKQKVDLQFSEGALLGTSVPISAAVDMDSGIFSIQRYTTEQLVPRTSPNSHPYFVIKLKDFGDSTIVSIVLNRTLDREIQDRFLIRVLAFDGGVPPKIGSMELNITVTDVNDNAPEFSQTTYTVSVNENIGINSTIISVSAHDSDQRLNGHVLYRLSPNQDDRIHSLFAINETTGDIRVIGSLMNGQIETYEITVWANDKAAQPLMSQTKVFVHVKDVVNSPPVIDVNLLSQTTVAEISEAAGLDAAVAHIKVSDPDKGPNGQLTCSVISDKFKLQRFDQDDREFKVVVAKPLNRETAEQHTVTVFCIDGGSPSQNASEEFIVHVLDENDNSPIFSKDTYEVNFAENNKIGASVLKVTARDFDSGKNAKVTYELDPTDRKYFAINPVSGVISASAVLDRENASLLSFPVYCKDGGSPSNTATTSVIVHVTDVNDNAPVFTESNYVFSIPENFARTVKIGILSAKDNDKGINGVVSFSLKSGKNVPFTVSPNGTVQSTRTLDREEVAKHQFEVIATDGGNPPLTSVSMVTVFVLDENDNRPEFKFPNSQNNTVVMSFQTPPNTIVTTIKTEDKDDALNSKVTYFLRSDDEVSGMFQLNSLSGRLILLKHLSVADAKKYTFSIIAQDKGTPPKVNERTLSVVITTQKLDGKVTANLQDHHREYFLIAVAIACVTVVLAVVIVIAIFLVRRADRLKKMCNNNGSHGDKTDPKKKVSFFTKNAIITTKPQKDGSGCQQQQFQTTLYDGQSLYQGINGGYSLSLDKLEVTDLDKKNRMIPKTLVLNGIKPGKATTSSSIGSGKRLDYDNHSDLSGEPTSDSGRGSEDDLNNSTLLSYSAEFDDVKCSSPRILTNNPFSNYEKHQNGSLSSDYRRNNISTTPMRPVSFSDKFFNFENNAIGMYNKNFSGFSPTGNSSICTGHDDSTTTSGSYTIDDEDDYVEVVQRSKQCIV